MYFTLVFWLFVAIPLPLKITVFDKAKKSPIQSKVELSQNMEHFPKQSQFLTI